MAIGSIVLLRSSVQLVKDFKLNSGRSNPLVQCYGDSGLQGRVLLERRLSLRRLLPESKTRRHAGACRALDADRFLFEQANALTAVGNTVTNYESSDTYEFENSFFPVIHAIPRLNPIGHLNDPRPLP